VKKNRIITSSPEARLRIHFLSLFNYFIKKYCFYYLHHLYYYQGKQKENKMSHKITVIHKSSVNKLLDYQEEYQSIHKAKRMIKYYQENNNIQKALEIQEALNFKERIEDLLDKAIKGLISWEEFEKAR
jgi:hypothetical protein